MDTPGIQRARAVLDWLNEHRDSAAARPVSVRKFVVQHAEDPHFKDEYELLKPFSEGAGIIYVVDGSCPFGADYEAEMEILRWSGRPSLALINPIENHDFIEEWTAGLGQFFQTVRVFDAHRAEITKQMDLNQPLLQYLTDKERRQPGKYLMIFAPRKSPPSPADHHDTRVV